MLLCENIALKKKEWISIFTMAELSLQDRFRIKELELNSLLEITQAINNNLPEDSLYRIYNFILRANLAISKLALYVLDEEWNCKVNYGTKADFLKLAIDPYYLTINGICGADKQSGSTFNEFDTVIPVMHKENVLALAFIGALEDQKDTSVWEEENTNFVQALSNIIIVAIENKKLARKQLQQEALRKEIEIASDVQQFLFPESLPYDCKLKIEASYLPHDRVGGDYYDYIPINRNQFLICIADVSGKGIPAAILMSNFQASLRTMIRQTPNLSEIVSALNYQVLESAKGEKFITCFAGIYDHNLKTLVYINSGHNPPLLIDKEHGVRQLNHGSTVLGAFDPLPFINEGFVDNLDDFLLFCYTDGLTETENEQDEEFGTERLHAYFDKHAGKDIRGIHKDILMSLDDFKGSNAYKDDITILSCRIGS